MSDGTVSPHEQLRLAQVEATERLVDALAIRRFREHDPGQWRGRLDLPPIGQVSAVEIEIPTDFPFVGPTVKPLTREDASPHLVAETDLYYEVGNSWHREPGGRLCLFEDRDHSELPWADPDELFAQVQAWVEQDRQGWLDDTPTLDLERYLPPSTRLIRVDDDLTVLDGTPVELVHVRGDLWRLGARAKIPRGSRGRRRGWRDDIAFVHDIGAVTSPIRDWESLIAAAGDRGPAIAAEVGRGLRHLLLLYRRKGNQGVLALGVRPAEPSPKLTAHQVGLGDPKSLARRSHPEHERLARRRVAVVGVGAVGSVLADLLHRSGVGGLHLVDYDVVLPGNLVRHLVGDAYVGLPKTAAVRAYLQQSRPGPTCKVTAAQSRLSSLDQAIDFLTRYDVVVDATADSTASTLLGAAARAGAGYLVSVAVLADGYAVRADHIPPPGAGPLAPPRLPAPSAGVYETGCGSPVSTTPPAAAWEAATVGARHALDALLGEGCPGEQRILRSGPAE